MLVQLVLLLKLQAAHLARVSLLAMNPLVAKHLLLSREFFSAFRTSVLTPFIVRHTLFDVVLHYFLSAGDLMGRQVILVLKLFVAVLALDRHIPIVLRSMNLFMRCQSGCTGKFHSAMLTYALLAIIHFGFCIILFIRIIASVKRLDFDYPIGSVE